MDSALSPVNIWTKCMTSDTGKKKESPSYYLAHCTFHRKAFSYRNMSEKLETVFQAAVGAFKYVKKSTQRGILFAKM